MRRSMLASMILLASAPAAASELFVGLHKHSVQTPLSIQSDRERGVDLSLGIRGAPLGATALRPYAFASINSAGDTNFLATGLSARFGKKLYVQPGLGIAIHDGSASNVELPDRLAFGSRILFAPELAIGARLDDRLAVEASWVHFSHAQIFGTQNPGIDNIGVRLAWKI